MTVTVSSLAPPVVELSDADDFTRLSVRRSPGLDPRTGDLGDWGALADDVAWLDVGRLATAVGEAAEAPPDWRDRYDRMIEYARGAGWVSADDGRVRAHVETL